MAKVYIGVGHGGSDPGAVKYLVEKDIDLQMAKGCRDYLKEHGVEVLISRNGDIDSSINEKQQCVTIGTQIWRLTYTTTQAAEKVSKYGTV